MVYDLSLHISNKILLPSILNSRKVSTNFVLYYTLLPVCQVQESNWTHLPCPRQGSPVLVLEQDWLIHLERIKTSQSDAMTFKSERHLGMKNRLTSGRYFSYIFSWRAAFRLSPLLVTQDGIHSSGLAAALISMWSTVQLMKGISDSSCGREASAASWRFRALNSHCSTNWMLFGAGRKVFSVVFFF